MTALRVLLAAPEGSLRSTYRAQFAREGFCLTVVTTGLDCLRELRTAPPDVLVVESGVPWGGGTG